MKLFIHFDAQLNEMLEEKVRPYMQNIDSGILSQPIILPSQDQNQKVYHFSPFTFFINSCWALIYPESNFLIMVIWWILLTKKGKIILVLYPFKKYLRFSYLSFLTVLNFLLLQYLVITVKIFGLCI